MSHSPIDCRDFTVEGAFLDFIQDGFKVKYMRVAVGPDELQIKLSKQARSALLQLEGGVLSIGLRPWDRLQISGQQTTDRQTGQQKLRADRIVRLGAVQESPADGGSQEAVVSHDRRQVLPPTIPGLSSPPPTTAGSKPRFKVLACQKSGCRKKGGDRQQRQLQTVLQQRGLQDLVSIEDSSCLGKCSQAPNIVLMPGKQRLSGLRPEAIVDWIEQRL